MGIKLDRVHTGLTAWQAQQHLAGVYTPQSDGAIVTASGQQRPVWIERHVIHLRLMTGEGDDWLLRSDLPQGH